MDKHTQRPANSQTRLIILSRCEATGEEGRKLGGGGLTPYTTVSMATCGICTKPVRNIGVWYPHPNILSHQVELSSWQLSKCTKIYIYMNVIFQKNFCGKAPDLHTGEGIRCHFPPTMKQLVLHMAPDCTYSVDLLMTVFPLALALHMLLFVPPVFSPFLFVLLFVFFCLFGRPV